jgi:hypothetical protein
LILFGLIQQRITYLGSYEFSGRKFGLLATVLDLLGGGVRRSWGKMTFHYFGVVSVAGELNGTVSRGFNFLNTIQIKQPVLEAIFQKQ